jgi:quercetin dioxygenase-like cupin family protein
MILRSKTHRKMGWGAGLLLGLILGSATTWAVAGETQKAPRVVHLNDAVKRTAPNGKAQIALLAQGQNAFLGRLQMDGGGKVPTHRDATEEYIYILKGSGTITIDGKVHAIKPLTAIYMPAGAEVSYENGPDPLVALQVFAGPAPAAKYEKWSKPK